ncbi:MAG: hypothetical protein H7833_20140 [Magnetococcus sp. DMHC-1]|nr:hypothetical protein [Magnetococcales bacterium]
MSAKRSKSTRRASPTRRGFDWEGFFLVSGIGLVSLAMSALFLYLVYDGIPKGESSSRIWSLSQGVARALPNTVKEGILAVMGVLFGLFGLACVGAGLHQTIKALFGKN